MTTSIPSTSSAPASTPGGLAGLRDVKLSPANEAECQRAAASLQGSPTWRRRKLTDIRSLYALSQIAPRLKVKGLDAVHDIHVLASLECPVPTLPDPAGDLVVATEALLGVTYPERILREPLPGYSFVTILAPMDVFHGNVSAGLVQRICLAASLPVGTRLIELFLLTHAAITMRTVQLDEMDPAGVLRVDAVRWWQRNTHRIPLSKVPFLGSEPSAKAFRGGEP